MMRVHESKHYQREVIHFLWSGLLSIGLTIFFMILFSMLGIKSNIENMLIGWVWIYFFMTLFRLRFGFVENIIEKNKEHTNFELWISGHKPRKKGGHQHNGRKQGSTTGKKDRTKRQRA